jgi:hypothetical protein
MEMTIKEAEIARFGPDKQAEIRSTITQMVRLGYKAKYLELSERVSVLLDYDAIETDAEIKALKDL